MADRIADAWTAAGRTIRRLLRQPAFTAMAMLILAAGVGANAAMYSLVDALLLRPPRHVVDPSRVVRLQFARGNAYTGRSLSSETDYPTLVDIERSGAFVEVAGYFEREVSVGKGANASRASALLVSAGFFHLLGSRAAIGRLPAADGWGRKPQVVVLAHDYWKRHFRSDPAVIGRPVRVDGAVYSVAAVAPRALTAPLEKRVDLWMPLDEAGLGGVLPGDWRHSRGSYWLELVARLKGGSSAEEAEESVARYWQEHARGEDSTDDPVALVTASLRPGGSAVASPGVRVALWLAGLTTCVLLIACANLANLMAVRGLHRRRSYAVQLALGATGWHVGRQLVAELMALGLLGLLASFAVYEAARGVLPRMLGADALVPPGPPELREVGLLLLTTASVIAVAGSGSWLQLRTVVGAPGAMYSHRRSSVHRSHLRWVLLCAQAALCLPLLYWAGLFTQSLSRAEALDLGVELSTTLQVNLNLDHVAPEVAGALYRSAANRLRAHPDVMQVALAEQNPYMYGRAAAPWTPTRSRAELWNAGEVPFVTAVGAGFFSTVGAKSLRGRDFAVSDSLGARPVVVLNAPLAERLWPGGDAVGQCVWLPGAKECALVVGVLGGVWKFSALMRDKMVMYVPLAQAPGVIPGSILVSTRGSPAALVPKLRPVVQGIRPDMPAATFTPVSNLAERDFGRWRQGARLLAGFGMLALLVTGIGIYGIVAYAGSCRLREIGVRLALGAPWHHVVRLVAAEAAGAVALGLAAGSLIALLTSQRMSYLLFRPSPRNAALLGWAGLVLLCLAAVAAMVPIRRALRVSPAEVLRSE